MVALTQAFIVNCNNKRIIHPMYMCVPVIEIRQKYARTQYMNRNDFDQTFMWFVQTVSHVLVMF